MVLAIFSALVGFFGIYQILMGYYLLTGKNGEEWQKMREYKNENWARVGEYKNENWAKNWWNIRTKIGSKSNGI